MPTKSLSDNSERDSWHCDTAEAAEFERNSDAQLSNALIDHNADVQLIANNINALSYDIRNSDDPAEIAQLLVDLRAAIMEKISVTA